MFIIPALVGMQEDPENGISRLILQLGSDEPQVRDKAAGQLKALGVAAAPALTRAASSPDSDLALLAHQVLRWIQTDSAFSKSLKNRFPRIVDELSSAEPKEWSRFLLQAYSTLVSSPQESRGFAVEDLRPLVKCALEGASTTESRLTICTIARFSRCSEATDALVGLLQDATLGVRCAAADALGMLGTPDQIPALAQLLRDPERDARYSAASAIGTIGTEAAIPFLERSLDDPEPSVRRTTIESLSSLGRKELFLKISRSLADDDPLLNRTSIRAVQRLYEPGHAPALVERLTNDDPVLRQSSLLALAYTHAGESHPAAIIRLLVDPHPDVRRSAALAVGQLGLGGAEPSLNRMLAEEVPSLKRQALEALALLGARESIPRISSLIKDGDATVRQKALEALGDLRAGSESGLIVESLKDPSYLVRRAAIDALGLIRPPGASKAILPFLRDSTLDGELSGVAAATARALGRLESKDTIPDLLSVLNHESKSVRIKSAKALAALGSPEGVGRILAAAKEDRWITLFELNALRSPAGWRKLGDAKVEKDLHGTPLDLAKSLCHELSTGFSGTSGLTSSSSKAWIRSLAGAMTMREALESLSSPDMELILESDQIRSAPRNQAIEFWSEWLGSLKQVPSVSDPKR